MMRVCHRTILIVVAVLALAEPATAQNTLTEAQALYANAQYEEALTALNRLRAAGLAVRDVPPVEQYRALCLLALGRAGEAEEAIAAVITAVPSYAPPDRDVSPRVRSAFQDVRRRVIPVVMQEKYGSAKAAFERQEYAAARDGFAQVTAVLADPALADLVGQPPLADLALLAKGFHDLSLTSLAVAPATAAAATPRNRSEGGLDTSGPADGATNGSAAPAAGSRTAADRPGPASRTAPNAPNASVAPVVYSGSDARVAPPDVIRQALPPYPRKPIMPQLGVVEVVIDERGLVTSATMRQSIDAVYDALALAAARTWQYRPAMKDGVAVKFRKSIQIRIQP